MRDEDELGGGPPRKGEERRGIQLARSMAAHPGRSQFEPRLVPSAASWTRPCRNGITEGPIQPGASGTTDEIANGVLFGTFLAGQALHFDGGEPLS